MNDIIHDILLSIIVLCFGWEGIRKLTENYKNIKMTKKLEEDLEDFK